MKTLEQAFAEQVTVISTVESLAREILAPYCSQKNYLLIGRSKTLDSLRDKIETGRYPDLQSVDDLVAFSVVIDTSKQESDVRRYVRKNFNLINIRAGSTLQDERIFDFDCTRIYCKLEDKLGLNTPIFDFVFEIQIRTLLQHAWSKITHPLVYKSRGFDAKAGRLAAELMAQLEAADRDFSRFKTTSRTVKLVTRKDMSACSMITEMIDKLVEEDVIPKELRPSNGRRLGENIFQSIRRDKRHNIGPVISILREFFLSQKGQFPLSTTLFQLSIVALYTNELLEKGSGNRPRRYYITSDLVSLFR